MIGRHLHRYTIVQRLTQATNRWLCSSRPAPVGCCIHWGHSSAPAPAMGRTPNLGMFTIGEACGTDHQAVTNVLTCSHLGCSRPTVHRRTLKKVQRLYNKIVIYEKNVINKIGLGWGRTSHFSHNQWVFRAIEDPLECLGPHQPPPTQPILRGAPWLLYGRQSQGLWKRPRWWCLSSAYGDFLFMVN